MSDNKSTETVILCWYWRRFRQCVNSFNSVEQAIRFAQTQEDNDDSASHELEIITPESSTRIVADIHPMWDEIRAKDAVLGHAEKYTFVIVNIDDAELGYYESMEEAMNMTKHLSLLGSRLTFIEQPRA